MATGANIYRRTPKTVDRRLLLVILLIEAIIIAIVLLAQGNQSEKARGGWLPPNSVVPHAIPQNPGASAGTVLPL